MMPTCGLHCLHPSSQAASSLQILSSTFAQSLPSPASDPRSPPSPHLARCQHHPPNLDDAPLCGGSKVDGGDGEGLEQEPEADLAEQYLKIGVFQAVQALKCPNSTSVDSLSLVVETMVQRLVKFNLMVVCRELLQEGEIVIRGGWIECN